MVDFSDALDKVQKVMDKDIEYQKECDALLDENGVHDHNMWLMAEDIEYQKRCDALLDEAQAKDDLAMALRDEEEMSDDE